MMRILAVFGSPRRGGNTERLLEAFLEGAAELRPSVRRLRVTEMRITPCSGCQACETEGQCPLEDDMQAVYGWLDDADLVVLASPVYFYGLTAQSKALIDRCQVLWARRHRLGRKPARARAGYLISAGGSHGPKLFECAERTTRYFCEAMNARYLGALTFRGLDRAGDVERHPEFLEEARRSGRKTVAEAAEVLAAGDRPPPETTDPV